MFCKKPLVFTSPDQKKHQDFGQEHQSSGRRVIGQIDAMGFTSLTLPAPNSLNAVLFLKPKTWGNKTKFTKNLKHRNIFLAAPLCQNTQGSTNAVILHNT